VNCLNLKELRASAEPRIIERKSKAPDKENGARRQRPLTGKGKQMKLHIVTVSRTTQDMIQGNHRLTREVSVGEDLNLIVSEIKRLASHGWIGVRTHPEYIEHKDRLAASI
jgi:hypothetical protein